MGWRTHTNVGADRTVHVWPEHDEQVHNTGTGHCWCGPNVEEVGSAVLVRHCDELDRLRQDTRGEKQR